MKKQKNNKLIQIKDFLKNLTYFFPVQLSFVHLKKNHQLLLFWLLLFLIIFKQIGNKYGIPLLFLAPEYLGKLSFSSYFIMGFAIGGFVMSYNISSYIMNGFRFPFLATLSKPFLKYCINNSLLPFLFIVSYTYQAFQFLSNNETFSTQDVMARLMGFLGGYFIFILFSLFYFIATNKDLEKLFGKEIAKMVGSNGKTDAPAKDLLSKTQKEWYGNQADHDKTWKVTYYIGHLFRIQKTRPYDHYDRSMLSQVFRQNHINASVFEIIILVSVLLLGLFREVQMFIIPAAATVVLVTTMLLMITSAMRSWLHGWTWIVIGVILLGVNYVSQYSDFYYKSKAYGLSYETEVPYPAARIDLTEQKEEDLKVNIQMLNRWKDKNTKDKNIKPKAIFLASSGGGSRAMYWSFIALQHLDKISGGELMNHSIMSTGSSGGMIGTAYFRELKMRAQSDSTIDPYANKYSHDMSEDMLNPILFTLAVNDLFIRTQRFEYDSVSYWKDRAYVFEKTLNVHSRGFMDKKLIDYKKAEENAEIPLMILSPSIVNDGRRMLISNLPMSFMTSTVFHNRYLSENVEYRAIFKNNHPLNTRFLSALRMNASFPYIMTTVDLPTNPPIEVFDAGLRDNYGIKTIVKYIYNIRHWLEENTSGIVILQLRDGLKNNRELAKTEKQSMFSQLMLPFGSLYGNWFKVQDYNNDELIEYATEWYKGDLDLINYQLNKHQGQNISLSWHLTAKEKGIIVSSLDMEENRGAEKMLMQLLDVKR